MEDALLRLRDENLNLKKQNNMLADDSKRLHAKMNIIEVNMGKVGGGGAATTALKQEINARQLVDEMESLRRNNKQLQSKLRHQENDAAVKAIVQGRTVPYGRMPKPVAGKMAVGIDVGVPGTGGAARPASRSRSRSVSRDRSAAVEDGSGHLTARALATSGRPGTAPSSAGGHNHSFSSSTGPASSSVLHGRHAPQGLNTSAATIDPAVHQRLIAAEAAAANLRSENAALRSQLVSAPPSSPQKAASYAGMSTSGSASTVSVPRSDLIELERQLKDKTSQVLLLKSRYDSLEGKAGAEREVYDKTVAALEEQNSQVRDMRTALQAAEADIGMLRSRLRGAEDAEADLRAAREEVRRLERSLTDLCESPFIAEGRDATSKRERMESAEKELHVLREQVTHLQHSVRSQHSELTVLRREKRELADAAETLKEEADKARLTAETSNRAAAVMRERLALYSGVLGGPEAIGGGSTVTSAAGGELGGPLGIMSVPPEELQRALVLVRKRLDTGGGGGSEGEGGGEAGPDAVPALRRKVQQLQLALVSSQRELERCEAMLKAQTTIAADLGSEVADLNERLGNEGGDLRRRLGDTEALAERRLQRVQLLEAQVRQLLTRLKEVEESRRAARSLADAAGRSKPAGSSSRAGGGASRRQTRPRDKDDDASTVISELSGEGRDAAEDVNESRGVVEEDSVDLSSGLLDVGPGEAGLEVYVIEASLEPSALGRHDTTFALLDFYDFESQSSPLASGSSPYYNFSAQYRVTVDPFFLRHAASDAGGVRIDINQARGNDFNLVARATVPLRRLLLSSLTKAKFPALPLLARDGRIIGHIKVEVRVGAPLAPLWDALCKARPTEGAILTASMRAKEQVGEEEGVMPSAVSSAGGMGSTGRGSAANELVVSVVAGGDLRAPSGTRAPSTYVQYTLPLPGSLPATTSVASDSVSPVFSDTRAFPLVASARLLSTLSASPLCFTVYDESAAGRSTREGSRKAVVLGTVAVSLASVAEGGSIDRTFDVTDARGAVVGRLQVRVAWARPLAIGDTAPANAMARAQVHAVAGVVDRDGSGVKTGLLLSLLAMPEEDARAVAVVRDGLSAAQRAFETAGGSSKGASYKAQYSLRWPDALRAAADASSRAHAGVSSREVFDALTAPAVGAALDEATVQDAVAALLPLGASHVPVADVIEVFMPLAPATLTAFNKLRELVPKMATSGEARGSRRDGVAALRAALATEAQGEMRKAQGGGAFAHDAVPGMEGRLSRSGLGNALKATGVVVMEDFAPSGTAGRDPRQAADFNADPARAVTLGADGAGGEAEEDCISDLSTSLDGGAPRGQGRKTEEIKPTAVSTAATVGAGAVPVTASGPAKELRFESGNATPTPAAGGATPNTARPSVVCSRASAPKEKEPAVSIEVACLTRLAPGLTATLKGGAPLYMAFTFPGRVAPGSVMLPLTAVLHAAVPQGGAGRDTSLSMVALASVEGAGVTFGSTTTFPLPSGSLLAAHLASALAPQAVPEDADIDFTLSTASPTIDPGSGLPLYASADVVLARAVFSLHDLLDAGRDLREYAVPLQATVVLATAAATAGPAGTSGGTPGRLTAGSTVADLVVSVVGYATVKKIAGK